MNSVCAEALMSFEEYLVCDTEERCELQDGILLVTAPPTLKHVLIAEKLESIFEQEAKKHSQAYYCLREVGIRTGYRKSRILDIAIFEQTALQGLLEQVAVFEIAPLLAVEVVSQESIQRDYRYKRSEYAAVGIPEYWIVDPLQNKISVLNLVEGFYELESYTQEISIHSNIFPSLTISASQLFNIK